MFKKLFGATREEELKLLTRNLIITIFVPIGILLDVIGVAEILGYVFICVPLYIWGWSIMKGLFGIVTIAALFTAYKNFVVGLLIFFAYILVGYFGGMIVFVLGLCRFVYLKTEQIKAKKNSAEA